MLRIDTFYLVQAGRKIHRLQEIRVRLWDGDEGGELKSLVLPELKEISWTLSQLLYMSVFPLQISMASGERLLKEIHNTIGICEQSKDDGEVLHFNEIAQTQQAYREFEAVLKAELGQLGIFLVSDKNAMNTLTLVEQGEMSFPDALKEKVPSAIGDVRDAMKCIALELPTAAAFHLHRANETVLKAYWSEVANGEALPQKATRGKIVEIMEKKKYGDEPIRSSLRDLVRLHRNPTIHPDESLASVEEAINLYGAIRSIIGFMLLKLPNQEQQA